MRYALQPYIYTEARRTYDTGVAFFRPLYYDWPEDDASYTSKGEHMFGDQMLAAPIVAPADKVSGLAKENVWLPKGDWIEWATGKHLSGGTKIERSFSIDQVPVYLRYGAIVPMQPPMRYTGEKPVDPLILNIWPLAPGSSSSYSVYEDSGASVEYQHGVFARTPIKAEQNGDTLRVEIAPVEGDYPGMRPARGFELRLPGDWPPASITVNGVAIKQAGPTGKGGWSFEGNTLTTVIPIPSTSVHSRVVVEVHRAAGLTARRNELDGFAGAMTRLRAATEAMHQTQPAADAPDALIDAMQSGDRMSYHPESAETEIAHFHAALPKAKAALDEIASTFASIVEQRILQYSAEKWRPGGMDLQVQKQHRLDAMARAQRLVEDATN
ncbi:MAG: DUF5110 domain-containing protein [Terracidiphilus sp.]